MSKNLKNRINTSFALLLLLSLMFLNYYILVYFLMIIGLFSLLEFFGIIKILFTKKGIKQLLFNSLFTIYIFIFVLIIVAFSSSSGLKILIFVILLICITSDLGGFIFGKVFKGAKLTKISPNKTIAGAIGSILLSVCTSILLFNYFTDYFELQFLVIGLITSIGCQLGDLFFSFLKRRAALKDTGNFLPGHGGILDRIDGILLGLPLGFLSLIIIF